MNGNYIIMILDTLWMLFFWDTQWNEFPINLGTFKIDYFMPKLLESYGMPTYSQQILTHC